MPPLALIVADILGKAQGCGRSASGVIAGQERHWLLATAPAIAKIEADSRNSSYYPKPTLRQIWIQPFLGGFKYPDPYVWHNCPTAYGRFFTNIESE